MEFAREVLAIKSEMISWRRALHQEPELSFQEFQTSAFIEQHLRQFGNVQVARPTSTGVLGTLKGTKAGIPMKLGIRADIDALPLNEKNDLPYASQNPGVMHACGHDGHTAILLALAKLLSASKDTFCGEVRLIFQHAEELPPGGAIELVKAGAVEGLDAMLGLHLSTNWPTGAFGIKTGALTAAVDRFDIILEGKGGHCAYPEQTRDPIIAMAELILAIQSIVSRRIDPLDPAVVSICMANSGTAYNIIPGGASISASVRTFSEQTRSLVEQEVQQLTAGICQANGLSYTVKYQQGYPSVENDARLAGIASQVIAQRFGNEFTNQIGVIMPGEDFSYYLEGRPGFFVELGSRDSETGCDHPHHNPLYCLDEKALIFGLQYFLDMVHQLLDGSGKALKS